MYIYRNEERSQLNITTQRENNILARNVRADVVLLAIRTIVSRLARNKKRSRNNGKK